ncbi:hypothetical protein JRO89_XS04G0065600 [Xanthoceras sorbifolium]|uniref:Glycoside-hydrolase family GH114 TIM-barrel domain-containing protein n=1 Tax=Xanthoceras sorbifolium TaxID=99658 RepID=A0ABQ8I4G3_9ROSI|nr:hypothetical protein JRO89_XS04G0065600 [Xanthoceras sorbifolium]
MEKVEEKEKVYCNVKGEVLMLLMQSGWVNSNGYDVHTYIESREIWKPKGNGFFFLAVMVFACSGGGVRVVKFDCSDGSEVAGFGESVHVSGFTVVQYYELGPDDPPYAAKFYDCCGAEDPEAPGCTTTNDLRWDVLTFLDMGFDGLFIDLFILLDWKFQSGWSSCPLFSNMSKLKAVDFLDKILWLYSVKDLRFVSVLGCSLAELE